MVFLNVKPEHIVWFGCHHLTLIIYDILHLLWWKFYQIWELHQKLKLILKICVLTHFWLAAMVGKVYKQLIPRYVLHIFPVV